MQNTLVLLKPDSVQRGLVGELITRIERRGLKLTAMKLVSVTGEQAARLYAEHVDRPFYSSLTGYITSSPLVAMVVEGDEAVRVVRSLMGDTRPLDAAPGTVRGDYATSVSFNLIHGSDSPDSAAREVGIFFADEEILSYDRDIDRWIIGS